MTPRRSRFTIVLGCLILLAGCRLLGGGGKVDVNPDVLEMLEQRGEAPVMVALVPPAGYDEREPLTAERQEHIARLQDEVLGSLDAEDFHLRRRFEAVPALAGIVLSERGLRVLTSHRGVARVDLDVGGRGAAEPKGEPDPEAIP